MRTSLTVKRPPFLLYSYLAGEIMAPFLASFIIMNGVSFLVRLIPFLNTVLEYDISPADFIRLFSYLFPTMLSYSIPMAAMLGVTIGFSRLANDSEMLAFKASGISIYQVVPPLLVFSFLVASVTAYFSVSLIPAGNISLQKMMYQLAKEKIDRGIREQTFTEALGDLVVHVGTIDRENRTWHNVWVSDNRERAIPAITMANSGTMRSDVEEMKATLILNDGSMHVPEPTSSQIITFDRYILDIPLKPLANATLRQTRGTMNLSELLAQTEKVGADTEAGGSYFTEYLSRLVLPVGCFTLALFGLPLGLQAGPGKRAIGIPLGLGIYIIYYVVFSIARGIASNGGTVAAMTTTMWLPNLFFLALAVVLIRQTAHEQQFVPPVISSILAIQVSIIQSLFHRAVSFVFPSRRKDPPPTYQAGNFESSPPSPNNLHGHVATRVFHFPSCPYYHLSHTIEFKNVSMALDAGFTPCPRCRHIMDKEK
jgi:lipopolysaccharide export system permease protein